MKLAYTINEACQATGLGRTSIYELAKQGRLAIRKRGERSLIMADNLKQCLENLPVADISEAE